MRHRKSGIKIGVTSSHRNAMFRNMVTSLFKYDSIRTTYTRAKELRSWADHMITLAKRGDLHARRIAMSIMREKDVVHRLFEEANDRYGSVSGGYTSLVKIGWRNGDTAPMTLVELMAPEKSKRVKKVAKKAEQKTEAQVKTEKVEATAPVPEAKPDALKEKAPEAAAKEPEVQAAGSTLKTKDETEQTHEQPAPDGEKASDETDEGK